MMKMHLKLAAKIELGISILFIVAFIIIINPHDFLTREAKDFKIQQLSKINIGMSEQEVIELLGRPLRIKEIDGNRILQYTDVPSWLPIFYTDAWVLIDGTTGNMAGKYAIEE
jgi:hypothetical protein